MVWRRSPLGAVAVWLMERSTLLEQGIVGAPGEEWKIIGVGDVDGDGKSDLVWHNTATGAVLQ